MRFVVLMSSSSSHYSSKPTGIVALHSPAPSVEYGTTRWNRNIYNYDVGNSP
jgi:hypothetical protein